MKKLLVFASVAAAMLFAYGHFTEQVEAPENLGGLYVYVEEYVRENISTLSSEPAALGGTFYVTDIQAADGSGTVWYEDGHIACIADFSYLEDKYGVTVNSFEVRPGTCSL